MSAAFDRGWYAARQALGDRFAEILGRADLSTDVWSDLTGAWDALTPPVQARRGHRSGDGEHHGARADDPLTSASAVREHAPQWDALNGRALRIHYEYRDDPRGLTDWEVERIAAALGGLGACAWKRVGELRTEYDPPLILPVLTGSGVEVTRPGAHTDPRIVCRLTDAGRQMYVQMKAGQQ